ncbi:hypothetical protein YASMINEVIRUS_894, partial [Yasminevirus sp. GU-2018]
LTTYGDIYKINKDGYALLCSCEETNTTLNQMVGGAKGVKHQPILSQGEKIRVMKAFDQVSKSKSGSTTSKSSVLKTCNSKQINTVKVAVSGMMINKDERSSKTKKELCDLVVDAVTEQKSPLCHDDSITSWGNYATQKYGLTVGDIKSMKFGEKMDVIIFDRNVGDYTHGKEIGTKYDPKKEGCTYATYIHGEGLTGILNMYDVGVVHAPFTWELNLRALDRKAPFWGPIDGCGKGVKNSDHRVDINNLDPEVKVGWRGPAIRMTDAKNNLPDYVVHYGTWWDDYMPFKSHNVSK